MSNIRYQAALPLDAVGVEDAQAGKIGAGDDQGVMPAPAEAVAWRMLGILWAITFGTLIGAAGWVAVSPLQIRFADLLHGPGEIVALAAIAGFYTFLRPVPRIAMTALGFLQAAIFNLLGAVLSYLAISSGHPYADTLLAACDHWLGFDWVSYASLLRSTSWSNVIFARLYQSSFPLTLIFIMILGISGRFNTLHRLLANISLGLLAINLIAIFLPALGAYTHYGQPPLGPSNFVAAISAIHDGTERVFDFALIHGVLTFPSYHAVLSTALILAGWQIPYLRYPTLVWNLGIIVAIPAFGEHYLVDVISGIGLTLATDYLWRRLASSGGQSARPARSLAA